MTATATATAIRTMPSPDYIQRARDLRPLIAAASDEIEEQRRLPERVVDALVEAGMFKLVVPRSVGGAELDILTYVQTLEQIAQADASTAWALSQGSGCSMSAAYLDPATAREVFGPPRGILAWGPYAPQSGKAVKAEAEGGYRITGRWGFASGNRHAMWLGAHMLVFNPDGSPLMGDNGRQEIRTFIFPRDSAEIIDDWHVLGLRGTGSDSYAMTDLFVPARFSFRRDNPAERKEKGPIYGITSGQLYACGFSFVSMGIARGALDAFLALAKEKIPRNAKQSMAHNNVVQHELATGEAKLRSSRAYMISVLTTIWNELTQGSGKTTQEQLIDLRLAATWAINNAAEVVHKVYNLVGSEAIFTDARFERRLRDINAGTQQGQGRPVQYQSVAQAMFGFNTDVPLFR